MLKILSRKRVCILILQHKLESFAYHINISKEVYTPILINNNDVKAAISLEHLGLVSESQIERFEEVDKNKQNATRSKKYWRKFS